MAPLDRALARAHRQGEVAVAEDLDLDVAWLLEVALEIDRVLSEGGARPVGAGAKRLEQLALVSGHLHADPSAAGRRLDQQRIADRRGRCLRGDRLAHVPLRARHDRHARSAHHGPRLRFVLDRAHRGRRRPDEDDAVPGAGLGELRLLGEEAVAGVDRLRSGLLRRRGSEPDGLVARLHVQRVRVRVRIHGDGLDAERPSGPCDAASDLAAVGDEDLFEHAVKSSVRGAQSTPEKPSPAALTALASRA